MRKILFLVNAGKISPNENGGAAVYYSHLELLHKTGFLINLLVLEWNNNIHFIKEDYKEIEPFINSLKSYELAANKTSKLKRLKNIIFNPEQFEYSFVNKNNAKFLQNEIEASNIDFIWCEWRWAAIWATNANIKLPIIYSHHDWEYKLAPLRKQLTLKNKFHNFQKKRVEISIVKKANACVSGSYTEVKEIEKKALKNALYIPTTYKNITIKLEQKIKPNIVHLGGMNTTANRLGLERFLDICWEGIKKKIPEIKLVVIGSLNQAQNSLLNKLKDPQIECLGFVKDLDTVMYPNDIHIVPWEYNTGTRTRIPVVLNYEQVLVATKASVSCYPEITIHNSILCENLYEMTSKIIKLYFNEQRLHSLSKIGKETFFNFFTVDSQQEKIRNFINSL